MRRPQKPLAEVATVTSWIEPIDGGAVAAVAEASITWKGCVYAASTFLLAEPTGRWAAKRDVVDKLLGEVARGDHVRGARLPGGGRCYVEGYRGLPMVARLRDLNRA